ncbi:MAG: rocF [Thermoleophilia bacterium]|nr:rocF [Thermoleophilia bacterium]MCZ4497147.1 rocF [Thermoleophilia bacterium]
MKDIGIIGFPMDLGGNSRGVDMGPSALRLTRMVSRLESLGLDVVELGNVLVHTRGLISTGTSDAHFLEEILRACDAAAEMTVDAVERGFTPLMLGGDHSVAIGSLWGMSSLHGRGGAIWIDAHADLNTPETSISGNVHGMPLAVALGLCSDDPRFANDRWPAQALDPQHTVIVAARDLDSAEQELLRSPNAPRVFSMQEIDRRGIAAIADEALAIASGAAFLHVSLDLDALDPRDAPGVGTPVRGGLDYREAHTLLEIIAAHGASSVDVVEVNPVLDVRNQTAETAAELICSLFGASII